VNNYVVGIYMVVGIEVFFRFKMRKNTHPLIPGIRVEQKEVAILISGMAPD
jgi:hypothetical protein